MSEIDKTEDGTTPRRLTLTHEDFATLLVVLGYAAGAAAGEGNAAMMRSAVRAANAVNKDNPDWTPYELPAAGEEKQL